MNEQIVKYNPKWENSMTKSKFTCITDIRAFSYQANNYVMSDYFRDPICVHQILNMNY